VLRRQAAELLGDGALHLTHGLLQVRVLLVERRGVRRPRLLQEPLEAADLGARRRHGLVGAAARHLELRRVSISQLVERRRVGLRRGLERRR